MKLLRTIIIIQVIKIIISHTHTHNREVMATFKGLPLFSFEQVTGETSKTQPYRQGGYTGYGRHRI